MLPRSDLYSEMPGLVDNSDDEEMPANSNQRGDLPPFEWNHPPGRGVSHEPTEDLRVQVRDSVLRFLQAVDRLEDYGFRMTVMPEYHQEVHMDLPFDSGEPLPLRARHHRLILDLDAGIQPQLRGTLDARRHTEAIFSVQDEAILMSAGLHGQAAMWTQAGPHGGTAAIGGFRQPGHDDEEITHIGDDQAMPPLVSDTDDDESPLPPNQPVPIWHGPDARAVTTLGRITIRFFGPSRGPCRSPAGPWGFAKPGRHG